MQDLLRLRGKKWKEKNSARDSVWNQGGGGGEFPTGKERKVCSFGAVFSIWSRGPLPPARYDTSAPKFRIQRAPSPPPLRRGADCGSEAIAQRLEALPWKWGFGRGADALLPCRIWVSLHQILSVKGQNLDSVKQTGEWEFQKAASLQFAGGGDRGKGGIVWLKIVVILT